MTEGFHVAQPTLVILVGPASAGKSTWAEEQFAAGEIISSDRLRGQVGEGEWDQSASADAFELLERMLDMRLARRLTTVVDTLGFDREARRRWIGKAHEAGLIAAAVVFDTPPALCRERNRARKDPVPARVLDAQLSTFRSVVPELPDDGFDAIHEGPVTVRSRGSNVAAKEPEDVMPEPGLRFGLVVTQYDWPADEMGRRLVELAQTAEHAGFTSLWVMDHLRQIPQAGRSWDPMLESYTTLAYLAAATETIHLGTLVTFVGLRNVALLGKIIATLDVLSGGRARCGLGAGWYQAEAEAFGIEFPSAGGRLDLLEDALQALPVVWGAGSKSFEGRRIRIPEALNYPRPLQERIPLLVGGEGERRTLRLVAQYADACNLKGTPEHVAAKIEVLRAHCRDVGRDPGSVAVTHFGPALAGRDEPDLRGTLERLRPARTSAQRFADDVNAGTDTDLVGHFRTYAGVGVSEAMIRIVDATPEGVARFGPVIEAFAP